jgi:putative nucleotidyltransferase with HDIG domain
VKSDAKETGGGHGAWVLALGSLVVAGTLFAPLPIADAPQTLAEWLEPRQLGAILALGFIAAGFWAFRRRFWPRDPREHRSLQNSMFLVVIQAVLLRAAVEVGQAAESWTWPWLPQEAWLWMPWFFTSGLAVILLGGRFGLLLSLSGALLLYLRADPGPLPLIGCLVSSLGGILLLRRSPTRYRVLRAGVGAGVMLGAIAAIHGVMGEATLEAIAGAAVAPVLIGLAAALALLMLLPVMEWMLGELSDVTLIEYGSDHSLLDQLKEQAPGTWHHTLNVADLAEKAAATIGARALFCRTAAFFHDIGKLKAPAIFAENIDGPSPHDDLDPRESARQIIEHVTHGLELARKHRLPRAFRDIIAEHHGISLVRFFYARACEQLQEGEDPETLRAQFCYPGPPPSTRESGIIALADTLEAATRSLGTKPEGELRAFVGNLIAERIAEGELARCPLTLSELARVQDSFCSWLKARHHQRPAYPKPAAPPTAVASTPATSPNIQTPR